MNKIPKIIITSSLAIALFVVLGFTQQYLQQSAEAVNNDRMVPHFEVDPFWPQPLPNKRSEELV